MSRAAGTACGARTPGAWAPPPRSPAQARGFCRCWRQYLPQHHQGELRVVAGESVRPGVLCGELVGQIGEDLQAEVDSAAARGRLGGAFAIWPEAWPVARRDQQVYGAGSGYGSGSRETHPAPAAPARLSSARPLPPSWRSRVSVWRDSGQEGTRPQHEERFTAQRWGCR